MKNHGKTMGKLLENYGKNYGKTMEKLWENFLLGIYLWKSGCSQRSRVLFGAAQTSMQNNVETKHPRAQKVNQFDLPIVPIVLGEGVSFMMSNRFCFKSRLRGFGLFYLHIL